MRNVEERRSGEVEKRNRTVSRYPSVFEVHPATHQADSSFTSTHGYSSSHSSSKGVWSSVCGYQETCKPASRLPHRNVKENSLSCLQMMENGQRVGRSTGSIAILCGIILAGLIATDKE